MGEAHPLPLQHLPETATTLGVSWSALSRWRLILWQDDHHQDWHVRAECPRYTWPFLRMQPSNLGEATLFPLCPTCSPDILVIGLQHPVRNDVFVKMTTIATTAQTVLDASRCLEHHVPLRTLRSCFERLYDLADSAARLYDFGLGDVFVTSQVLQRVQDRLEEAVSDVRLAGVVRGSGVVQRDWGVFGVAEAQQDRSLLWEWFGPSRSFRMVPEKIAVHLAATNPDRETAWARTEDRLAATVAARLPDCISVSTAVSTAVAALRPLSG